MCAIPARAAEPLLMATEPYLQVERLARRFPGGAGVHGVSLEMEAGEVVALIGPSGSGKTTTLRLLAGFESPDTGVVRLRGRDVTALGPAARRFGMVFQHYALFPHLTVGANVAFGLASLGLDRVATAARVAESLALVELDGTEARAVGELSGGQQQRVALARAVAPAPAVLLLDEPLSNLDPALRERTRNELRDLIRRIGITTVLVTHEQEDAFDLADRVALLLEGRLAQVGTPDALYRAPATLATAGFVGRGRAVQGELLSITAHDAVVRVQDAEWTMPVSAAHPVDGALGPVLLFARPESLWFDPSAGVAARVERARLVGATTLYTVRLADDTTLEVSARPGAAHVGDTVRVMPSRRGGSGLHCYPLAPRGPA